jgi:hypothetical protein
MASEVQACNLALSHLGNRGRVASISPTDGSAESDYCASFFALARNELLEMADWGFARKRVALALVTSVSDAWEYSYALPSDCMVPRRILTDVSTSKESDSAPFDIEGQTVLTDKQNAVLIYTRPITDFGLFSPSAVTAFSYLLASYLAGPILKGTDGASVSAKFREMAANLANTAAAHDANHAERSLAWGTPSGIAARNGGAIGASQVEPSGTVFGSGYVVL